ncbi:hypothetical protein LTS18_005178 [Coniosporium uncinatum]|uniref:Uncharacterized protein n=1 Tax=Coniosporium uncinatum TaxID=93489 RepID=A0ACC3D4Y6_9PEZI|nr:hypothetical protein LTS18_005178 [Coniosporium uncinatum]
MATAHLTSDNSRRIPLINPDNVLEDVIGQSVAVKDEELDDDDPFRDPFHDPDEEPDDDVDEQDTEEEEEEDDGTPGEFQTKQKLTPSQPILLTVEQLIDLLNGPYLDINPDYQRGMVWSGQQMSGLINSLLENYYVPPILFKRTHITLADGSTRIKRVCVNGKQRLSSIKAFVNGKISCRDRTGKKWCVR